MEVAGTGIQLTHRSDVGEARRRASELATALRMPEEEVGRVALVTTELAANVVKHALGGWCYMSPAPGDVQAVDLVVTDRGHGISDLQQAFADGHSTAGTPGTGIGAVRRQSAEFDVFTKAGGGTVVAARIEPDSARSHAAPEPEVEVRGFSAPIRGEDVCGDTWAVRRFDDTTGILVADGLGHGPGAATASRAAARAFMDDRADSPATVVERIHEALSGTRGAAVAVARLDPAGGQIRFAGIGNIAACVLSGSGGKSMVSSNGTAGYVARTVQEFVYDAPPGSLVVLHSDGLTSRWDMGAYPGLSLRSPAVIAGLLLRDFSRPRDDVSVVVARMPPGPGPA